MVCVNVVVVGGVFICFTCVHATSSTDTSILQLAYAWMRSRYDHQFHETESPAHGRAAELKRAVAMLHELCLPSGCSSFV
jgi:disulfide oxidoreductase YuzD